MNVRISIDSIVRDSLYVRDELPANVSQSYDAFVANGKQWLTMQ